MMNPVAVMVRDVRASRARVCRLSALGRCLIACLATVFANTISGASPPHPDASVAAEERQVYDQAPEQAYERCQFRSHALQDTTAVSGSGAVASQTFARGVESVNRIVCRFHVIRRSNTGHLE